MEQELNCITLTLRGVLYTQQKTLNLVQSMITWNRNECDRQLSEIASLLATTSGHISAFENEFTFLRRQAPVNTSSAASSSASPPQHKVVTVPIAPDSAQHRAIPPDTPATPPLTAPSTVQAALPPPPDSRFGSPVGTNAPSTAVGEKHNHTQHTPSIPVPRKVQGTTAQPRNTGGSSQLVPGQAGSRICSASAMRIAQSSHLNTEPPRRSSPTVPIPHGPSVSSRMQTSSHQPSHHKHPVSSTQENKLQPQPQQQLQQPTQQQLQQQTQQQPHFVPSTQENKLQPQQQPQSPMPQISNSLSQRISVWRAAPHYELLILLKQFKNDLTNFVLDTLPNANFKTPEQQAQILHEMWKFLAERVSQILQQQNPGVQDPENVITEAINSLITWLKPIGQEKTICGLCEVMVKLCFATIGKPEYGFVFLEPKTPFIPSQMDVFPSLQAPPQSGIVSLCVIPGLTYGKTIQARTLVLLL